MHALAHECRLHLASRLRLVDAAQLLVQGRIVEMGDTESIFASPAHPYTRALLSAIPVTDPDAPRQRVDLDPASVSHDAALVEVAPGHLAAVR